ARRGAAAGADHRRAGPLRLRRDAVVRHVGGGGDAGAGGAEAERGDQRHRARARGEGAVREARHPARADEDRGVRQVRAQRDGRVQEDRAARQHPAAVGMTMRPFAYAGLLLLAACATAPSSPPAVERMYVIDCGENHAKDLSLWTPGANVGKPHVFGTHCYVLRHAQGWMLWDSGNPDRFAALAQGQSNPAGTLTAFMKKPPVDSLRELGLAPGDIQR